MQIFPLKLLVPSTRRVNNKVYYNINNQHHDDINGDTNNNSTTLDDDTSLCSSVFKFMEQPENSEKMQDLKKKVKLKVMSLKVKEETEYAPELLHLAVDDLEIKALKSMHACLFNVRSYAQIGLAAQEEAMFMENQNKGRKLN